MGKFSQKISYLAYKFFVLRFRSSCRLLWRTSGTSWPRTSTRCGPWARLRRAGPLGSGGTTRWASTPASHSSRTFPRPRSATTFSWLFRLSGQNPNIVFLIPTMYVITWSEKLTYLLRIFCMNSKLEFEQKINLKVLSSEMDPAAIRLIR